MTLQLTTFIGETDGDGEGTQLLYGSYQRMTFDYPQTCDVTLSSATFANDCSVGTVLSNGQNI